MNAVGASRKVIELQIRSNSEVEGSVDVEGLERLELLECLMVREKDANS